MQMSLASMPEVIMMVLERGHLPRFLTEGLISMTKSGLSFVYCVYYVELLRFIALYWVVYFSESFGFVYSRDVFRVEGFPLQRPDWRVIFCINLLFVFPTRNIVNFLMNFVFNCNILVKGTIYSLFVLKVPINPKSINRHDAYWKLADKPSWLVNLQTGRFSD